MFFDTLHPGLGRFLTPAHPASFGDTAPIAPAPAPTLGGQTEEVLADILGLSSGNIGRLFDRGIVEGPVGQSHRNVA